MGPGAHQLVGSHIGYGTLATGRFTHDVRRLTRLRHRRPNQEIRFCPRIGGSMATVDLGDWREHWKRVLRWHARVIAIGNGATAGMSRDDAVDTVLAFFIFCYHLSDALGRSGVKTDAEVTALIKSNDALSLCRDLCIAAKHFEISAPYRPTKAMTTSAESQVFVSGGSRRREPVAGEHWSVKTDAGSKDMFDLADDCIAAWRSYLPLA
jgi:hypothetical protein